MLPKEEILSLIGQFTWSGVDHRFFVQTEKGNFEYSHPAWEGGTNRIREYSGSYVDWVAEVDDRRDKWVWALTTIEEFCGPEVTIDE